MNFDLEIRLELNTADDAQEPWVVCKAALSLVEGDRWGKSAVLELRGARAGDRAHTQALWLSDVRVLCVDDGGSLLTLEHSAARPAGEATPARYHASVAALHASRHHTLLPPGLSIATPPKPLVPIGGTSSGP